MPTHNLSQCDLVLKNLVSRHKADLHWLGARFVERVDELAAQAQAACERVAEPVLEDGLKALVSLHIRAAACISYTFQGYSINPVVDQDARDAAGELLRRVVVGRLGPQHSAADRVVAAADIRRALPHLKPLLALLPETVMMLVDRWLDTGEQIGRVLANRTTPVTDTRPSPAQVVRETTKFLATVRTMARLTQSFEPDAPSNLEARLMGFADAMSARRAAPSPARTAPPVPTLAAVVEVSDATAPVLIDSKPAAMLVGTTSTSEPDRLDRIRWQELEPIQSDVATGRVRTL